LLGHDAGRLAQRGLDVTDRRRPRVRHVALVEEPGGRSCAGILHVEEGGQGVVVDLHQLARVDGARTIDRHDNRDRLADVAHALAGEGRLQVGRV